MLFAGAGAGAATLLCGTAGAAAAATTAPATPGPAAPPAPAEPPEGLAPYASYWFPDSLPAGTPGPGITWRSLMRWTPESDPDLAYNTATVPLAPRFTPVPPNTTARAGRARIASLVSFGSTAGNPAQGSPTADFYALTHWAYIDELVFWGGSSGEGIVLAPNAPVTDAAHRNGVRVLGNVFLPPVPYGGDLRWTRDLVRQDSLGRFPVAEKLVEVARAYGFDGWFVNAETEGGDSELAARMQRFLRALRAAGEPHGLSITWYDAMNSTGKVGWQGALNELNQEFYEDRRGKVADTMFVDFRWTPATLAASGALADRLGRRRHELWAAVDTESHGWNATVDWDAIVPRGSDHVVSYGFYRPEWTRNHLADRSPGAFHRADDRFWTGESLDPARPSPEDTWRAPATVVADRSTVSALPFACSFNTGHGERWYEDGEPVSDTGWNHLGLQDRLPGRRWAVHTTGTRPEVTLDFARAWRGGSSLLVAGALTAPVTVGLHATRLPLTRSCVAELVHSTESGPVTVEFGVATREPSGPGQEVPYTWLKAQTLGTGRGWRTARVRLSELAGATAHGLAVRITRRGKEPVRWRLGAVTVREAAARPRPATPGTPAVSASSQQSGRASLRLTWQRAAGPPSQLRQLRHYEVSRVLPDGTRRFLGGTCGTALYLPAVERAGREEEAVFEIRAVDEVYAVSAPARTTLIWTGALPGR
ncbi:endo-beta-N-acetylglucosaminidase [Streptomyces sp. NBC_00193]|uniref:endo-beta-N-acetylglucosaminidase n=1 Tax=unclassified Streptomyces TaxID=2593676 RepID=UPI00224D48DC|nr:MULTISPECIES: endo-beta-N-acetylglucosaminidase [unclassified Streptomyces]MCX5127137.1 endo-beta-N-acetylglucosaminidase [Streptomyces sp. NBC_00347]MCX5295430.1 endo-beta-N-acetylglucosaminidase [Streptomyces sp. NBC_00193]